MYNRLFGSSPSPSRLENCQEIKNFFPLLQAITAKKNTLAMEAKENGAESVDFKKHTVFVELLNNISNIIDKFNALPPKPDPYEELEDVTLVMEKISDIVNDAFQKDEKILAIPRNEARLALDNLLHYGIIASFIMVSGLSLTAVCLGYLSSGFTRTLSGTNNLTPESHLLISALNEMLLETKNNLIDYLERNELPRTIKKTKEARTFAAIILSRHGVFRKLPLEAKSNILSYVRSGDEKIKEENAITILNCHLLETVEHIYASRNRDIESEFVKLKFN